MKRTIESLDDSGAEQKYTNIMSALEAADRDPRIRTLALHTVTGEHIQLHRDRPQVPFQLQYIDHSDSHLDDGFEAQTRDRDGRLDYWPTVSEAVGVARRHGLIWKISFPIPSGERVRLVRQLGPSQPFVLDMMEAYVQAVIQVTRGGTQ